MRFDFENEPGLEDPKDLPDGTESPNNKNLLKALTKIYEKTFKQPEIKVWEPSENDLSLLKNTIGRASFEILTTRNYEVLGSEFNDRDAAFILKYPCSPLMRCSRGEIGLKSKLMEDKAFDDGVKYTCTKFCTLIEGKALVIDQITSSNDFLINLIFTTEERFRILKKHSVFRNAIRWQSDPTTIVNSHLQPGTINFLKFSKLFIGAIDPDCKVLLSPSSTQREAIYKKFFPKDTYPNVFVREHIGFI